MRVTSVLRSFSSSRGLASPCRLSETEDVQAQQNILCVEQLQLVCDDIRMNVGKSPNIGKIGRGGGPSGLGADRQG
eukprot:scaffold276507_cov35-Tisochrysis_lutea.AAC.2